MKRQLRLYNVLFPIWMLFLWPGVWLILLPGNFLIDSLVLLLAMTALGYAGRKAVWKSAIVRVWGIGFAADLVGAGIALGLMLTLDWLVPQWNTFRIPGGQLLVLPGIAIAGVLIYFLNRRFSFRRTELTAEQVHRLSLALAVFTAPYTMLIPTEWIYG
ncbi:MAG: hypothetical protein ACI3VN_00430 [Candidatus Onthomonas sp.]